MSLSSAEDIYIDNEIANEELPVWQAGVCYSGHEIILLATELEKIGYIFYKHAEKTARTQQASGFFHRMANEELEHIKILNKEIKPLLETRQDSDWRNDEEISQYLWSVLGPDIFPGRDELKNQLKNITTQDEALEYALQGEDKSIKFYQAILESTKCSKTHTILKKIIDMEEEHKKDIYKLKTL
jgi:rubrerythrin